MMLTPQDAPITGFRERSYYTDAPVEVHTLELHLAEEVPEDRAGFWRELWTQFRDSKSCEATIWTLLVGGAGLIAVATFA